ncbi:hypothetical protein [Acetobacter syzygii]|uniref:Type IV pilus biogenesis protein PilP n=2 Tax=Acetobacter syzygii TaxID=146476 RepID=A0A270B727_9PROT|nr:hypothetical protein [Acetobacter syzygii]NSL92699.1 hypothetical protein [Acetobacter syzygii]PAL20844.1 hypothetical protein B9K05_12575 [Acetobacter syzygii]PAL22931.1 hypothetical protein B9K04_12495 [Acetobacter syzygii]
MRNTIFLISTLLLLPVTTVAAVPECAMNLQQPPVGGTMTPQQIDANNACQLAVQQASIVADAVSHIHQSEERALNKTTNKVTDLRPAHSQPPQHELPRTSAEQQADTEKPEINSSLPTVDAVSLDAGKAIAYLRYPQGGTIEASRGTRLKDGSTVEFISMQAVYIKQDHSLKQLSSSGSLSSSETNSPADIQPLHRLQP